MNKSRFLCAALATFMLAGCSIQDLMFWKKEKELPYPEGNWQYKPALKGGTEAERLAILDTVNNKPISNKNGKSTDEIYPEVEYPEGVPTLSQAAGDGLKLTTSQVQGDLTVKLNWEIDETQAYFGGILRSDDAHNIIEINYPGKGNPDGEFVWKLATLECGSCTAEANMVYKAKTVNEEYRHDNYTLAQVYAIHDQELVVDAGGDEHKFASTFDIVDYEYHEGKTYSPYFKTNNPEATEKQYLYLNVPGKVIYTAPDGNWGLLADGKNMLEFYAGSGTAFNEKNWPNLANKYVRISGNMSQYCGNVQMGFVTRITALKDEEKATLAEPDPLFYRTIDESLLSSLKVDGYTCAKQAVKFADNSCLCNGLGQVTGTLVPGSLKNSSAEECEASALVSAKRFTFELQVGSEKLQVAYDYHTDKEGKVGLFNALKEKVAAGGSITLKGTMRYSGNDSGPFITEGNNGVWSIVPFLADHVA